VTAGKELARRFAHETGAAWTKLSVVTSLFGFVDRRGTLGFRRGRQRRVTVRSSRPWDREKSFDRESSGEERAPRGRQPNSDEQALTLRDSGRTFAAVASSLGLKRSSDARAAFLRALARRPENERARLSKRELERLDQLEARIRDRDRDAPEKMQRRLGALAVMRDTLPRS
jgi:hypothetical protein